MKKLIFANCILAIAVIFSFCAKPDLKEELASVTPEIKAENRATCTLTNLGSTTHKVRLCGTNTNAAVCQGCPNTFPQVFTGVFQSPLNGDFSIALTTPIVIYISATTGAQTLFLDAGNGSIGPLALPAGGCRGFAIDDNCNITAL